MNFFLATQGLHCCARAFFGGGEWGLLFVEMWGLLLLQSSSFRKLLSKPPVFKWLLLSGLAAAQLVGSSQTCEQTYVPHIGRWTPNHWTTREVPAHNVYILWETKNIMWLPLLLYLLHWSGTEPMVSLRHAYTWKLFPVYLKFKFNQGFYICIC